MRKIILLFITLSLQINFVFAHIGNSNITLEGMAGPYHLLINIKPPDVIPGTASLIVFTNNALGIKIYARPIYFYSGENGAPSPDLLTTTQPGQFAGTLWLMNNGSASIELNITGPLGNGKLLVPVVAVSTTTQKLPPSTKYMLISLGIFLFILLITIVGASVSDGITKSGQPIAAGTKRAKKIGFVIATILCSVLVYGGNKWWQSVAKKTSQYVFKPMHATYQLQETNGRNELHLTIDTMNAQRSQWLPYIIPDHGKLMHFFIISIPNMDVFAHLHPSRVGPIDFSTELPKLPEGKYLTYADIVYNSGFTETIKDTLAINTPLNNADTATSDADDAVDFSHPLKTGNASLQTNNITIKNHIGEAGKMKDGTVILLDNVKNNKHYLSNELSSLEFSLWDKNNQPLTPDLYMGMKGHLIIVRADGMVFSHVHPVGTYSMAAQESIVDRINHKEDVYQNPNAAVFRDSIDGVIKMLHNMPDAQREDYLMKEMKMPGMNDSSSNGKHDMMGMNMNMTADNTVSFPYTFPTPGTYRIWVEVKKDGKIYTAVFDRDVK